MFLFNALNVDKYEFLVLSLQDLPIDSFVKSEAWRLMGKMKMRITHPELLMKPAINMKQPITNMKQPLSLDDDYPALTLIEPQINFQPVDLPVFQLFEKIATHSGLQVCLNFNIILELYKTL